MSARESFLKSVLHKMYGEGKYKKPRKDKFYNSKFHAEVDRTYRSLGGQLNQYPMGYRGLDIKCRDFIVELDEERHFNRYRLTTLESDFYQNYNCFDLKLYKNFCKDREKECLAAVSWGGNWKKEKSEEQFGQSNIEGCLEGNGSSRWKQRAFYDYLRDVFSHLLNIPVIRISIWEKIDNHLIFDDLLRCNNAKLIKEFITGSVKNFVSS